jgi:hydroxymethylpyrimidine pyrophosphatase-like HAD family hydrolase|eukprot:COSAG01_NODE_8587_length_2728_cov_4.776721_6_plen_73_part_00
MVSRQSYPYGFALSEVDGTLASPAMAVSPRVIAGLKALRTKGCGVIVATSLPTQLASSIPKELGAPPPLLGR